MPNYKVKIEYDGTDYVGWQRQDNGKSIQGLIELAVKKLTSEVANVFGAGRTDAGVHAIGQVANFMLEKNIPTDVIRDGLNQHLRPHPISIISAEIVDIDFNSRFSAKLRWYEYKIVNRRSPLTLANNKAWCVYKKLNFEKMLIESSSFIGKHQLDAFRSSHCQSKSTEKTITSFDIEKNLEIITFTVSAKSFLHSQVRIMVGTLVDIGKGLLSKSIDEIIKSKKRALAGQTAPACGLYLKKIEY
ncbi:MAG: tRNA pseudouridine synthase A [Alphaproteobacteria bacterium MarineAlpha5_Bin5]|nr:MAG: tRNA pseudouridine synthase A [Alphaproteobacteria bacterium MarineAlpha5_Bin5]